MGLTYNGATAGSTLANPPIQLESGIGAGFQYPYAALSTAAAPYNIVSNKIWSWASTSDIVDLVPLNSVNDGLQLGIKPGDVLIMVSASAASTSPKLQFGVFAWAATAATTGICLSSNVLSSTAV